MSCLISRVIKLITLQVADLRISPLSGRDYDSHRALTVRGRVRWDTTHIEEGDSCDIDSDHLESYEWRESWTA